MRITEVEVNGFSLDGGFEPDALDLELLDKSFTHAPDHVIDEGPAQTVQSFGLRIIALAADQYLAVLNFKRGAAWELPVELAFRPFNQNLLAFDFHLYLGRSEERRVGKESK